jgi:4-amino-4-deoxy-L-arabinose transferase-like glycosyltransferase
MATKTFITAQTKTDTTRAWRGPGWQSVLLWVLALALLALGLWMRLHDLGLPFDRDGYDEGVYWQSLHAMSAGHALYRQTFYSQPPFFLLSIFPIYVFFGHSLWSARLGIAIMSLFGLVGALLLGKALAGRIGAIAAALLLIVDPFYLAQSQTVHADAPSAALSLLAVGLAYLWWEKPDGLAGICFAVLTAVSLVLSILSKLSGAFALVPVALLMLAHTWRITRKPAGERMNSAYSLFAGIAAFIITTVLVLLPFTGSWSQLWQGMVTFHTTAEVVFKNTQTGNLSIMKPLFTSITAIVALYGAITALLRRDWRVLPLIAWFLAAAYMLWTTEPLFQHHLVALIPPFIALEVMGIGPIRWQKTPAALLTSVTSVIALILILVAVLLNAQGVQRYYRAERLQAAADLAAQQQVVKDLRAEVQPGQLVITDAQFIAGLADRSTPSALVDTSIVRIDTGYLTSQQLIQEASQPQVRAVLFYTGRLNLASTAAFHAWITRHFHLVHNYGNGKELWVKV